MTNIKLARLTFTTLLSVFNEDNKQYDLEGTKEKLQEIIDHLSGETVNFFDITDNIINVDSDNYRALQVLETCCTATDSDFNDFEIYELLDIIEEIKEGMQSEDDFNIDTLPCGEVRIIDSEAIDQIWTESLIEQVKECYDLSDVPDFVSIDWEQTAQNCKVDGMGHHFAGYDGEEHSCNNFYIFRTN